MSRPVSKFAEWLARASIQDTFGLCGLLALVCWICCSLGRRFRHLPLRLQQVSWRSFFQAPTPGVLQWLDIPTYLQGGVLTALVIANTIVISLHAPTWADVQRRAGCLAVTHLVPLCSGFSFSLPAHVYYVERDTFYWAHRWLGRICVLHCLLHGSVLGANARNTSHGARLAIPLMAGCSLVSILPWTLAAILRRWPQLGLKVHHMLALTAIGALFYHLIDRVSSYRWVLLGGAQTTRTLRIVTRPRPGVTGRIAQAADHATYSTIHFPVCVLGPYGHPPNPGQYGTVVFVLEDIGLFRALPFIRHLVKESRSRRNTVRRLEVLWQVRLKHFSGFPHSSRMLCGVVCLPE
ncbi:Pc24g02410 [Penicillium rubens Wisconsin 54-1255]|uniref:Pc24g02410 protein n=1 Tax=Penicillium rubens (strain ATCC 28089 / DSM 1075 / NRRL 1951 / Wisconsin 54-1255) TaxID=500485 RepID=B6HX20_PENRW|nr:Pc24g02410 [Penicillium rubens Wisconsin 54-1255]